MLLCIKCKQVERENAHQLCWQCLGSEMADAQVDCEKLNADRAYAFWQKAFFESFRTATATGAAKDADAALAEHRKHWYDDRWDHVEPGDPAHIHTWENDIRVCTTCNLCEPLAPEKTCPPHRWQHGIRKDNRPVCRVCNMVSTMPGDDYGD